MKFLKIVTIILIGFTLFLTSCKDAENANPKETTAPVKPAKVTPASFQNAMNPAAQNNTEPAQNAAGIWHYTCASGCAGGAGTPSNCKTCGNVLVHNTTYHQ
ncbi:MAG: hypothetical protein ACSHWW_07885 [Nonlabens sp.]|uniref:hypothetical protein n=1 Tax=Nonlabens sp. TaxID=1888209 RepID=UPI003EF27EB0